MKYSVIAFPRLVGTNQPYRSGIVQNFVAHADVTREQIEDRRANDDGFPGEYLVRLPRRVCRQRKGETRGMVIDRLRREYTLPPRRRIFDLKDLGCLDTTNYLMTQWGMMLGWIPDDTLLVMGDFKHNYLLRDLARKEIERRASL